VPAWAPSIGRQLIMLVLYWFMTMSVHASVRSQWMTCLIYIGHPPKSVRVSLAFAQCMLFQRMNRLWFTFRDQRLTWPLGLGYRKATPAAPTPKYFQRIHPWYQVTCYKQLLKECQRFFYFTLFMHLACSTLFILLAFTKVEKGKKEVSVILI
jgi:hypothetical protein